MKKKFIILITRPAHQAEPLCEKIHAIGGEPILFPTIEIAEPTNATSLLTAIKQLNDFDIAIFTSSNAVLKTIPYWPKRTPANLQIIANGPATAKKLAEFTLPAVIPDSPFTSEKLLELSELQNIKHKKIIIFTGEDGRGLLEKNLRERGADIHIAYTYRRIQPPTNPTFALKQLANINFILITSYDSLKNLLAMLKDQKNLLLQKKLVVISARLAKLAKELGFEKIVMAENATDNAIIKLLQTLPIEH